MRVRDGSQIGSVCYGKQSAINASDSAFVEQWESTLLCFSEYHHLQMALRMLNKTSSSIHPAGVLLLTSLIRRSVDLFFLLLFSVAITHGKVISLFICSVCFYTRIKCENLFHSSSVAPLFRLSLRSFKFLLHKITFLQYCFNLITSLPQSPELRLPASQVKVKRLI